MKGAIRTKEKCPACASKFPSTFICPTCKTIPTRFYVDFSWHGQRIKIFSDRYGDPLDSFRRALALHSNINQEIEERLFDPSKYIKVEASKFYTVNLMDRFLTYKLSSIAPSYQAHYKGMAKKAREFFGVRDVRELRKLDMVNYADHLSSVRSISGKTQKNYLDHFRAFLRWCKSDLEILSIIPSFPRVEINPRPFKWMDQETQVKILEAIPAGDQPIIRFLMLHGCRPAEARALKAKDVDLKNELITISATFSGRVYRAQRKGRGAKPVIIPIHPEMSDFFASRLSGCLPGAWIFINPRNGMVYSENALRRIWEGVRAKMGLSRDIRLYDATRHSLATQLRAAGASLQDIKDQLGHSDIRTTEKYAHGNLDNLRANLEKLSLHKINDWHQTGTEIRGDKKYVNNS